MGGSLRFRPRPLFPVEVHSCRRCVTAAISYGSRGRLCVQVGACCVREGAFRLIRAVCSGAFRLESWAEGRRHAALHADAVLWALAGARTAARRRRKALCRHLAAPGKVAVAKNASRRYSWRVCIALMPIGSGNTTSFGNICIGICWRRSSRLPWKDPLGDLLVSLCASTIDSGTVSTRFLATFVESRRNM